MCAIVTLSLKATYLLNYLPGTTLTDSHTHNNGARLAHLQPALEALEEMHPELALQCGQRQFWQSNSW